MSIPQPPTRLTLLESVRRGLASTRGDLGQVTGLSRSVVAQVVSELVAEGLLIERRVAGPVRRGRPTSRVQLAPQQGLAAGIDVSHRHIAVILSELDGRAIHEQEIVFDVDADAAATFRAARRLLDAAIARVGVRGRRLVAVGVSLPFPVVGVERVVAPVGHVPGWAGARPHELLRLEPGTLLIVDNDADAGAWGELMHDDDARSLLFVKVGEGLGSALAVGGQVFGGAHHMAGEIGHVLVPGSRLPCRCGGAGCLDAVVTRAVEPDASASEIEAAGTALGGVLAQLASFVDPDVVVVGGTVGSDPGPFAEWIATGYNALASRIHHAPLRAAVLGRRSELRGALDRALGQAWHALATPSPYVLAR
ncbi:ROK family transcriptional regulator [Nocardioides sp. BP30]|uniref:ROK family transcriptional regulator n=1 Tax=Nocardioides sp. BP30 TaxID=3036374 RepID=UPI0024689324|nr:ROK family transcriptional regulator [Nocardioides sp. BP30]WGL52825.1 ROK family transcriptional regulator [Nocardioides sp. BP30]